MVKILSIQKSLSGENLHGRGGRCDLSARLPQRGREPHPGGREDLLQGNIYLIVFIMSYDIYV